MPWVARAFENTFRIHRNPSNRKVAFVFRWLYTGKKSVRMEEIQPADSCDQGELVACHGSCSKYGHSVGLARNGFFHTKFTRFSDGFQTQGGLRFNGRVFTLIRDVRGRHHNP